MSRGFRGYKAVFVVLVLSVFAMPVSAYALEQSAYAFTAEPVLSTTSSPVAVSAAVESAPATHLNVIVVDPVPCRIVFNDCDLQPLVFEVNDEGFVRVFEKDLPLPKREGYAFGGWYMDDLRKTPFLDSNEPYRVLKGGEVALFPLWTKLQPNPDPPAPEPDPKPDPPAPEPDPKPDPPVPDPAPTPSPDPAPVSPPVSENPAGRAFIWGFDAPFGIAEAASDVEAGAEQGVSALDGSERAPVDAEPSEQAEEELSAQGAVDGFERGLEEGLSPSVAEETPVLGVALLAVLGTTFLALSVSIALDVRVLIWYAGKKKAVQAESGVEI